MLTTIVVLEISRLVQVVQNYILIVPGFDILFRVSIYTLGRLS